MDPAAEKFRMEHAGLLARSAQGHAAKGMKIKDQEDMWVSIQHNTFKNWVNVQLRDTGLRVENLSEDLCDGLALVTLVETLQKRKLRKVKRVMNQHQALENVTTALNAIAEDGIKLVNIGNVDIVNGNLKLILGLIWSLIMHYQIGQTKFPPKKLMLTWLKAVLPECHVTNFTSDWNSGVNLGALVDYCRPGLFRNWKNLDPSNAVDNCRKAMDIASREFNIPMVLEPEYLASPYLDDLSGMTYLSYFMKEGGPGYKATLDWVRKMMPEKNIKNFTSDWNDGHNLGSLIKKLGGPVPGYKNMNRDERNWESNLQTCLDGGRRLGVDPILSASDMARPDVEYLGPMAYLAYFQWVPPRKSATESIRVRCDKENVRVNNPVPFRIDFLSKDVVVSELRVDVNGPSGPVRVDIDSGSRGAKGSFTPNEVGFYELLVRNEGEHVDGSPFKVRVLPDVSKIMFSGIDPCALGSIVEVMINSNGAGGGEIEVVALSPTRRRLNCPVKEDDGVYTATFQPDEAGEWSIGVAYDDEHIQGSPFTCHVYDPNAIKVYDLDNGTNSSPGKPFSFIVDASACGWGDAKIDVTHDGRSVPSKTLEVDVSVYEVTFTPYECAKYKVYVYFNGHEVRGSPFPIYLGVEKPPERKNAKNKKKKSSKKDASPIVKEYTSVVDSPLQNNHNTFNKTYDSSMYDWDKNKTLNKSYESTLDEINESSLRNKNKTLNKSYESTLDEINTSSSRNYFSSLSKTKSSTLNRSSDNILNRSSENSILSRDYSKTLEKFREPTKTLTFDFPSQRTTFDIPLSDKHTSSLKRNSVSNINRSFNTEATQNSSFNSTLDSTMNSSASTVINTALNSPKKYSTLDSTTTTTHDKYSSKYNSFSNNILSDDFRSTRSPLGRSPMESPRSSPLRQMESPRSSPFRQMSPPLNPNDSVPHLSAPSKVLLASQTGPKTTEERKIIKNYKVSENGSTSQEKKEEYSRFEEDISNFDTSTIKTKTKIYKSEERLVSSSPVQSPRTFSPRRPLSPRPSSPTPLSSRQLSPPHSPYYIEPDITPLSISSSSSSLRKNYYFSSDKERGMPSNHITSSGPTSYFSSYREGREDRLSSPKEESSQGKINSSFIDSWEKSRFEKRDYTHNSTTSVNDLLRNRSEGISENNEFNNQKSINLSAKDITITGPSIRLVSVGEYAEIVLTSNEKLKKKDVNITVTGPGRRNIPVTIEEENDDLLITFKPLLVGEYNVHIKRGDHHAPGSPFKCYVYNAEEIKVGKIPDGVVGQPVEFEIDGSSAGSGNLEILVNGGHVTSNVRNLGQQKFWASFVPHTPMMHSVEMKFNDATVPGSPWSVNVMESAMARVSVMGEALRHFPAGQLSSFDISAPSVSKEDIEVHIVSPSKRPVSYQLKETSDGLHKVSFITSEVGSYVVDVVVAGQKVQGSPFIAKAYDAGLIRVSDVPNGVVGQPCQFRVDASQAGEGQLEISINDGEVPNHVQVLGGGRCLVSFTPDAAKTHTIDIKFNGESVRGCPFVCRVSDTSRVSLTLRHLELIPVGRPAAFNISVDGGGSAELTVTVRTPSHTTLPVRVSGSVRQGFSAEFTPVEVGAHTIIVNYNDSTVSGTPFTCKVYDASKVGVSHLPRGAIGKTLQFIVDASEAGEGNLEISISAAGRNIPTQVHPQGSARFGNFVIIQLPNTLNVYFQ